MHLAYVTTTDRGATDRLLSAVAERKSTSKCRPKANRHYVAAKTPLLLYGKALPSIFKGASDNASGHQPSSPI